MVVLFGFLAYAKAGDLLATTVPVLAAVNEDGSTIAATGLTTGAKIKFTCSTSEFKVTEAMFYRGGSNLLPNGPAATTAADTAYSQDFLYTTVQADEGDSVYTCKLKSATIPSSAASNSKTVKVSAATTTTVTTTTKAGGSGSGAGSNSPVMAIFLLSIAAMCF